MEVEGLVLGPVHLGYTRWSPSRTGASRRERRPAWMEGRALEGLLGTPRVHLRSELGNHTPLLFSSPQALCVHGSPKPHAHPTPGTQTLKPKLMTVPVAEISHARTT